MVRSRILLFMLAGCIVLATGSQASGVTVTFRQAAGTGYVSVPWDAVSINPGGTDEPDSTTYHLRASGDPGDRGYYLLVGIKGLLTELPLSSSEINTATLTIVGDWGDSDTMILFRVTSDWLTGPAGENETDTDDEYRDMDAFLSWASGSFSVSDYDATEPATYTFPSSGTFGHVADVDVTQMVKDMCDAGNSYGWCITNYETDDKNIIPMNPSSSVENRTGRLAIDYTKAGNFALTVNSGTGSGSYAAGTVVTVTADPPPTGGTFAGWDGDSAWVAEPAASSSIMEMPPRAAEITATYDVSYTLTVNSGTGSGNYLQGAVVDIDADAPPTGYIFVEWVGDTDYVASTTAASTTVTMPAANVEVTATYTEAQFILTVNSGTGSGSYAPGTVVTITADAAPTNMYFDEWWGEAIVFMADLESASTTLTMPDRDTETTATYTQGTRMKIRHYYAAGWPNPDPEGTDGDPETPESGYVHGSFDDVWMHGPTPQNDDINHNDTGLVAMAAADYSRCSVVAVKDLFTLLPITSGGEKIAIHKAKLVMYKIMMSPTDDWPWGGLPNWPHYRIAKVTTDWVYEDSGSNDTRITAMHLDGPGGSVGWASGYISFDDWEEGTNMLIPHPSETGGPFPDGMRIPVQVTEAMERIYTTESNYGVVFLPQDPTDPELDNSSYWRAKIYHDSEAQTMALRPEFIIDYDYIPSFQLTVNSGVGGGPKTEGEEAPISANADPPGMQFYEWTGDTTYVASTTSASTTVTMPAANVEVTATYTDRETYYLTVNSGTGDGDIRWTDIVTIEADPDTSDYVFEEWVGATDYLADARPRITTVTMPQMAITVTAQFRERGDYFLTINAGTDITGHTDHDENDVVPIAADKPADGDVFDKWIGDTSGIADVSSMYTTLTMPAADAEITATYVTDEIDGLRMSFREGGGPTGFVDTLLDDTYLELDDGGSPNDVTHGTEGSFSVVDGPTTGGGSPNDVGLICVKDLLTELTPSTGGHDITINSAYLSVYRYQGPALTPFKIARVTTNWVPDSAGTNEDDVSGLWAENSGWTFWTDTGGFTTADYDTAGAIQVYMQDGAYNAEQKYDVTSLVKDIYTSNNYGLALIPEPDFVSPDYIYDEYYGINFRSSEYGTVSKRPTLQIDYQYGDKHTLTVNSGSGDGDYAESAIVPIAADAPATGKQFEAWTGDVSYVASTTSASTTVTMPYANVEVTATYTDVLYTLTVNSGTGGGEYVMGATPTITADAAPSGQQFDAWVGDTDWPGDLNEDEFVGQTDLDIVLDMWGKSGGEITDKRADVNDDDFVGQTDLDYVLDDWGKSGCQP